MSYNETQPPPYPFHRTLSTDLIVALHSHDAHVVLCRTPDHRAGGPWFKAVYTTAEGRERTCFDRDPANALRRAVAGMKAATAKNESEAI